MALCSEDGEDVRRAKLFRESVALRKDEVLRKARLSFALDSRTSQQHCITSLYLPSPSPLTQSPLLPPLFLTTLISPILLSIPLTALVISHTVKHPTLTAVNASISTPVFPSHSTVACTSMERVEGWGVSVALMEVRRRGWQRGMRVEVCLADMMAARWEMVRTSPFFVRIVVDPVPSETASPKSMSCHAASLRRMDPTAVAERRVTSFEETETIEARPVSGSMCVRWSGEGSAEVEDGEELVVVVVDGGGEGKRPLRREEEDA